MIYYKQLNLGRVIGYTDAKGSTISYEYDTVYPWFPSRVYFSDPENNGNDGRIAETLYEYSGGYGLGATKERIKCSDGEYAVSTYEYEPAYGNIIKQTDPNSSSISYSYDYLGRLKTVLYPDYSSELGRKWLCENYSYYRWSTYENHMVFEITKKITRKNTKTAFRLLL